MHIMHDFWNEHIYVFLCETRILKLLRKKQPIYAHIQEYTRSLVHLDKFSVTKLCTKYCV